MSELNEINYYQEIGKQIKELRLKRNMTRTELAEGICSLSHISRIESGQRIPTAIMLRQITNKLGVSPEYLFRAFESPTSLNFVDLSDRLSEALERNNFNQVNNIIDSYFKDIKIPTKHDKQMIVALKNISTSFINHDYEKGINASDNILHMTESVDKYMTDIHCAIMLLKSYMHICINQPNKALEILEPLTEKINKVDYFHNYVTYPRFYQYLALSYLDIGDLEKVNDLIDDGIRYCKKHNSHSLLREFYLLKSEYYYYSDNKSEADKWLMNSINLHELIKESDNELFEDFLSTRLHKRE